MKRCEDSRVMMGGYLEDHNGLYIHWYRLNPDVTKLPCAFESIHRRPTVRPLPVEIFMACVRQRAVESCQSCRLDGSSRQ